VPESSAGSPLDFKQRDDIDQFVKGKGKFAASFV
jgi:hypothetical protein